MNFRLLIIGFIGLNILCCVGEKVTGWQSGSGVGNGEYISSEFHYGILYSPLLGFNLSSDERVVELIDNRITGNSIQFFGISEQESGIKSLADLDDYLKANFPTLQFLPKSIPNAQGFVFDAVTNGIRLRYFFYFTSMETTIEIVVSTDPLGSSPDIEDVLMSFKVLPYERVSSPQGDSNEVVNSNGQSSQGDLSDEGRYVCFSSEASNLLSGDSNGKSDVFWKDINTGEIRLVSATFNGIQGNNASTNPRISGDGQKVVFVSTSTNFVNGVSGSQVYLKDMASGMLTLVSSTLEGIPGLRPSLVPSISKNGKFVVFTSDNQFFPEVSVSDHYNIYIKNLETGSLSYVTQNFSQQVSAWATDYYTPDISEDGNQVVFTATMYFSTGTKQQVYKANMMNGAFSLVSSTQTGVAGDRASQAPSMTDDGRYIVFNSASTNFGADGSINQVLRKNTLTGELLLVSSAHESFQIGNGSSMRAVISGDGRYVVFESTAENIVQVPTNLGLDVFMKDLLTNRTYFLSSALDLPSTVFTSGGSRISSSGGYALFASALSNLVRDDSNGFYDVFRITLPR